MIEFAPTPNLTNDQAAALVEGRRGYDEWEELLRGMNPMQMINLGERAKKDFQPASSGDLKFWMALATALHNASRLALNANQEAKEVCWNFALHFKNIAIILCNGDEKTILTITRGWGEQSRGIDAIMSASDPDTLFILGKINQWGIPLD